MNNAIQIKPTLRATLEVTYSSMRKDEMALIQESNCSLLIKRLLEALDRKGASQIEYSVPRKNKRHTDIMYEFDVETEVQLEDIRQEVKLVGGDNLERISVFVEYR